MGQGQPATVTLSRSGEIALLTVDNPPVNTISAAVRTELSRALDSLQQDPWPQPRALMLLCAGKTFFSGADISEFHGPPKEAEFRALFARFEALPMPVVAVLHGTSLGGGLEFALACHYRVAAAAARLGLPEVTLGIIPGAGGTQRMPRLIGAEKALELILSAKPISAPQALEWGIIDAVIDGDLTSGALAFTNELLAAGRGPRRTGEMRVDPSTASEEMFTRMTARAKREYPNREAALTAIEAVRAAARLPLAEGLAFEEQLAHRSKATIESRGAHDTYRRRHRGRHDGRGHCDVFCQRRAPRDLARRRSGWARAWPRDDR